MTNITDIGGAMNSILLVEDDENLSRGISYYLSNNGFKMSSVYNLKDASKMIRENNYDLIILDINLPDGNGFDFLKEHYNQINTPIVILTANNGEYDEVMGLELGAEDYICKPFSLSVLKARVERILNKARKSILKEKQCLISGDIRLDINEYKVFGKENEIMLSKTEFKLIKIFMDNIGQVLSKDLLLSRLWDDEGNFVDENTVAVNISRIRKKLEENGLDSQIIKTVHGIGYKWEA